MKGKQYEAVEAMKLNTTQQEIPNTENEQCFQ
jgi:hypothetical protein